MASKKQYIILKHFGYDDNTISNLSSDETARKVGELLNKSTYSSKVGVIDFFKGSSDYDKAFDALVSSGNQSGQGYIGGERVKLQSINMSPEEYISACVDIIGNSNVDDLSDEYIKSRVESLAEEISKSKTLEPVYLDIRNDSTHTKSQEGRHRMLALKKLGVTKVPVLIVSGTNQYSVFNQTNGKLNYSYIDVDKEGKEKPMRGTLNKVDLSMYDAKSCDADIKYVMYADGTMSQDGSMRALYWCRNSKPKWLYGAYADKFDENEANKISNFTGTYRWLKHPVRDSFKDKLIQSSSKEALSKNIATEIKAGKDPKQAAAIAYSIQKENDSSMKDGLNVTVKLNGKTYKGTFNGISGADKRFGDVYIPELVSLHNGDRGVFNPDEGNYVSDGKFYFKMENLKKWNPFLKDYIKDSDVTDAYPSNSFIYKGLERRIVLAAHDIAKLNALIDEVNRQFDLSNEERDKLVKLAQWYVSQKQQADSMKDSDTYQVWTINEAGKYQKEAEVTNPTAAKAIAQRLKQSGKWVQISKNNKTNILNDSAKENNSMIKDGIGLANLKALINIGEVDTSRVNTTGEVIIRFKNDADKKDAMRKLYQHRVPVDSEKGLVLYIDAERILSTVNDSMIKDTKFLVNAYKDGKLLEERIVNTKAQAEQLANEFEKKYGEYSTSIKVIWDSGSKTNEVTKNNSTVKDTNMFNITFERNGVYQSNLVKASSEEEAKQKFMSYAEKHNLPDAKIISVSPNREGYKPGKPVIDTQPVKVIAKKAMEMQDGCSRHYLEVEDCDGKRFYMVTDEYDGCSRQFAGGGSVIEDKALLNKKYKDDLASGLTSVGRSAISGAKEVKSKIEQASRDDAVDLEMYKKPLDNLMQCGQVKDGVSASKVDAMLGINDLNTTKQLLRDAGIKYSAVTSKVSQYKIVEGKCVKVEE